MTVKELKEVLENILDHSEVILSSDEEGNSYQVLRDVSTEYAYVFEDVNGWEGSLSLKTLTKEKEKEKQGYTEEDVLDVEETPPDMHYLDTIVLWP